MSVRKFFKLNLLFKILINSGGAMNLFIKGQIPWNKNPIRKVCLNCENEFFVCKSIALKTKFCDINCKLNYKYKLAKEFKLNKDLAELIGIIIGDGCINKINHRPGYRIFISGNKIEDKEYFDFYLKDLIYKCLNINSKPFIASNGAYILQFQNEPFRIFLNSLGICSPKAKIVSIPQEIKNNEKLLKACIRGIFDSDFTLICKQRKKEDLHYYPRITAQFASNRLVKDLEKSLKEMGFTLNCKYNYLRKDKRGFENITNFINLDGPNNVERWMSIIGSSNPRILTRYFVWKKYGHLKPKTTIMERKKLLMG